MTENIILIKRENIKTNDIKNVDVYINESAADRYIYSLNQEAKLNNLPFKYYKKIIQI